MSIDMIKLEPPELPKYLGYYLHVGRTDCAESIIVHRIKVNKNLEVDFSIVLT
jgi:hypothetical protein